MEHYRKAYSITISIIGLLIVALALIQSTLDGWSLTFVLLIALGVMATITMTSFVEGNAAVSVSSAISLTAAFLFGPFAGALVAAVAEAGHWALRTFSERNTDQDWWKAAELLGVNVGMNSMAALAGGYVLQWLSIQLGQESILLQVVPWLAGAIVSDQVNLWLLAFIIYFVHNTSPIKVWKENRWAIPISVLVMSVGGSLLALAVQEFDLLGIAIFFLPILLSAYSFRLTVSNAKKQMAKLEEMVAVRTQALAEANEQLGEANHQLEETVTELADTNKQLAETNEQLESANEELENLHKDKDSFLAVLTHDMRTPLTSIKGYASILRDRELRREQQVKIAKVIMHSQDTLLDIVNNILEIEKLQSGTPVLLEFETFDLALLAKTSVEALAAQALEKNITLHFDQVPTPIEITADQAKLQRVISNLISNAVKYTPEGGSVFVETCVRGRYANVSVRDTGYGIPADELPYIFDRYSRVKGHQHLAIGTGLGLAIVKSLVEAHHGEINVTSKEDVGSQFTIQLPLQQPASTASTTPQPTADAA